jgi:hypothetical protein
MQINGCGWEKRFLRKRRVGLSGGRLSRAVRGAKRRPCAIRNSVFNCGPRLTPGEFLGYYERPRAEVAELADAQDSKSCAPCGHEGSTPSFGTPEINRLQTPTSLTKCFKAYDFVRRAEVKHVERVLIPYALSVFGYGLLWPLRSRCGLC